MFRRESLPINPDDHLTVLAPSIATEAVGMRVVTIAKKVWTLAPWGFKVPNWPRGTELVLRGATAEGLLTATARLVSRDGEWTVAILSYRISNRRDSERLPIHVRVKYGLTRPERSAYTTNLSLKGCFIEGRSPGMIGEPCFIELHWGIDRSITLLAQIVRIEQIPEWRFAVTIVDNTRDGWDRWVKAWKDIQQWQRDLGHRA